MSDTIFDVKTTVEHPETGIEDRKRLAGNLSGVLADTLLLMVKTQAYHWNVAGPLFFSLHKLTEEHYQDLFAAADELAERIRALGYPAPSSITEMVAHSVITEDTGNATAEEMIGALTADHEAVVRRLREAVDTSNSLGDVVTADMLTRRMEFHEQAIWMLKAIITQ